MTLADLSWDSLQGFLLNDRKMSPKREALQANKSRYKKLQGFFLDKEFNRANFGTLIGEMTAQGLKSSTKNNILKMAKSVEKYLEVHFGRKPELTDFSYFREIYDYEDIDTLTPEEVTMLADTQIKYGKFSAKINKRNKVLILLLGETGCRIGEALNLRFSDVYNEPECKVVFRNTKNGKNRRAVIRKKLYEDIQSLCYDLSKGENEHVFKSERSGKALNTGEINRDLKHRARACGITKNVYNHFLRHSFVTNMLNGDVDSLDVAQLVGHSDPKTTMRYAHMNYQRNKEIMHHYPTFKEEMSESERAEIVINKVKSCAVIKKYRQEGNKVYLEMEV